MILKGDSMKRGLELSYFLYISGRRDKMTNAIIYLGYSWRVQ